MGPTALTAILDPLITVQSYCVLLASKVGFAQKVGKSLNMIIVNVNPKFDTLNV